MKPYCVYLTIYRGNKMPPFYIGSSSVEKVQNGYHGSVESIMWGKIWRQELKDNSHLFETKIVKTYNDRQEATNKEYKLQVALKVINNDMYINQAVAAKDGFFGRIVTGKNHPNYRNNHLTGKKLTEEHKKNQSLSHVGFTGKRHKESSKKRQSTTQIGKQFSEESKIKMSINHADFSGEKNPMYGIPPATKGKICITNGIVSKFIHPYDPIPDGWIRGMKRQKKSKVLLLHKCI